MKPRMTRQFNPWLALIVPLTMILLGYLVLKPHSIPVPVIKSPLVTVVFSPVSKDSLTRMLADDSLKGFQRFITQGSTGPIHLREALSESQALLEIMTGKDANKLTGAAVIIDPESYEMINPDPIHPTGTIPIWTILKWNRKRVTVIRDAAALDDIDLQNLDALFAWIRRTDTNDTGDDAYLRQCDDFLLKLMDTIQNTAPVIAVIPYTQVPCTTLFAVNDWLFEHGYLAVADNRIDWTKTRAFCVSNQDNGIRIHSRAVYDNGIVENIEYEAFQSELSAKLKKIIDPVSGKPMFQQCVSGDVRFHSRKPEERPDIVPVASDSSSPLAFDTSIHGEPVKNLLLQSADPFVCPSTGWLGMHGSPFNPIKLTDTVLSVDITATILFLLHQAVGTDMQGRILYPALTEDWRRIPRKSVPTHDRFNYRVHQRKMHETDIELHSGDIP